MGLDRLIQAAFRRSLWVCHANAGSCNGCDIEEVCAFTPYYDAERFGLKLVASPRHADVLLISGPVTRQMRERLLRLYEAVPDPKLVIGVGSCCAGGGIWYDTYHTEGGLGDLIPVDYYIPGCPPRPEAILHGIAVAAGLISPTVEPCEYKEVTGGDDRPVPAPATEGEGGPGGRREPAAG